MSAAEPPVEVCAYPGCRWDSRGTRGGAPEPLCSQGYLGCLMEHYATWDPEDRPPYPGMKS